MKNFPALFLISMICGQLSAQLSFSDRTDLLLNREFFSGVAVGISDMNGDGLDDLVRMDQGKLLQVDYQAGGCGLFRQSDFSIGVLQNPAWNIMLGDVNNDGFGDIMSAGASEGVKSLVAIPFTDSFGLVELADSKFFAQAANFVDIDRDGYLDAFICDDNAGSKIYLNQKDGTFLPVDLIDFNTVPPSDNSGNYGSVWSDFDSDGDLDLYIAKCRQGVDDPSDPRRINMLFVNDGENNFTNRAAEFGLADNGQSWTGDFGDLDGDGDLDCFVTNHDRPSAVYENLGDTLFVDVTGATGVAPEGIIVQGVLQDMDNDGRLDIIVSGTIDDIFLNEGNMNFTKWDGILNDNEVESFSIGDLNGDGFLDLYAGYANLYSSPSNTPDKLWLNEGNDHHFIRFKLKGDSSNSDGIGARVEVYGQWGKQIREVRAGESYGITLSHTAHFGLGSNTVIDSAVISWPSGIRDVLSNPEPDQLHVVREGKCSYIPAALSDACLELCPGDSVVIGALEGFTEYQWSNGDTGRVLTVHRPGLYFAEMTGPGGCRLHTLPAHVRSGQLPADLPLSETDTVKACSGTEIPLTAPVVPSYLWNTGDTTRTITVTESGAYYAQLITACESVSSDTAYFVFTDAGKPVVQNDTILEPGSGMLTSDLPSTNWYLSLADPLPVFQGDTFITPAVEETTTFYASVSDAITFAPGFVGQESHTGFSFYNSPQFNGGTVFDVESPVLIESVDLYTEFPGNRIIEIRNSQDEVVFSTDTIDVSEFKTTVILDASLEPGENYVMITKESLNNAEFGMNSPRLYRSDQKVQYPYVISDLLSIKTSTLGPDFFYYFYNWKVRQSDLVCEGERVPAVVVVDAQVAVEDIEGAFPGRVYPVPADQRIWLDLPETPGSGMFRLLSAQGHVVYEEKLVKNGRMEIDVSWLSGGWYMLMLYADGQVFTKGILILH